MQVLAVSSLSFPWLQIDSQALFSGGSRSLWEGLPYPGSLATCRDFVLCFFSLFNMVSMQSHHEDSALGLLFPFLPEAARAFRVPWPKIPKGQPNDHGVV